MIDTKAYMKGALNDSQQDVSSFNIDESLSQTADGGNPLKTLKDINLLDCYEFDGVGEIIKEIRQEAIKTVKWYDGYNDNVNWRKIFMKSYNITEEKLK